MAVPQAMRCLRCVGSGGEVVELAGFDGLEERGELSRGGADDDVAVVGLAQLDQGVDGAHLDALVGCTAVARLLPL